MKKDVVEHVTSCSICQQTKYSTRLASRLLRPIPPPTNAWEDISMDFIMGLLAINGHTSFWWSLIAFQRQPILGLYHINSHFASSKLFTTMICTHHGYPKSIIFDRDPIFMSKFWETLFQLNGTKLRMSTAYFPQTMAKLRF